MIKYIVYKNEIPSDQAALHGLDNSICMGCEFEKIDVWHVTLPGKPKRGYYNADISHIIDLLNECDYDKGYTIIKRRIKAVSYHNLPEFTGF